MIDSDFGYISSPIGTVEIGASTETIVSLNFVDRPQKHKSLSPVLQEALGQVSEYFEGRRRVFEIPIAFRGTEFQHRVWLRLLEVPFGKTASYKDIAVAIGNRRAVRAVGAANRANPISIIIPCHRIVGSDGSLTGYGSGLWRKEWLLQHEGRR